jgi:hypothetical protein
VWIDVLNRKQENPYMHLSKYIHTYIHTYKHLYIPVVYISNTLHRMLTLVDWRDISVVPTVAAPMSESDDETGTLSVACGPAIATAIAGIGLAVT